MACCSDRVITFHYVEPKMMVELEYLIYHVKPFGKDWTKIFDSTKIETPFDSLNSSSQKELLGMKYVVNV